MCRKFSGFVGSATNKAVMQIAELSSAPCLKLTIRDILLDRKWFIRQKYSLNNEETLVLCFASLYESMQLYCLEITFHS